MKVLACNAGSASLKFRLYQMPEECGLAVGKIEKIGTYEECKKDKENESLSAFLKKIDNK